MVQILYQGTRACFMLSFFMISLHGMYQTSSTSFMAHVFDSSPDTCEQTLNASLSRENESRLCTLPASKTIRVLFYMHTHLATSSERKVKIEYIGCLNDFKEMSSQEHAQQRISLINKIATIPDSSSALETLSVLANFLIMQKCSDEVIKLLYVEIHKLFPYVYRSSSKELREQARLIDLHALHNHLIIFLKNNDTTTSQLTCFVKFLECLAKSPTYPSQEKARKDAIIIYPHLAKQLEKEEKFSEAYQYYKKASSQTIVLEVALKANKKLLRYTFQNNAYTISKKRLFEETETCASLFEDEDVIDSKYFKY